LSLKHIFKAKKLSFKSFQNGGKKSQKEIQKMKQEQRKRMGSNKYGDLIVNK
jgi:hypothetical protein